MINAKMNMKVYAELQKIIKTAPKIEDLYMYEMNMKVIYVRILMIWYYLLVFCYKFLKSKPTDENGESSKMRFTAFQIK